MYKDYWEIIGDVIEDYIDWLNFEEDLKTNPYDD